MRLKSLVALIGLILGPGLPVVPHLNHNAFAMRLPDLAAASPQPGLTSFRADSTGQLLRSEPGSSPARLADSVSVHASGKGGARVTLGDGRELLSNWAGDAGLVDQMVSTARPLSMTAADLDGDGVPDLVTGFATQHAGGVAIYRGNVDAIYPNSPEALARKRAGTFTSVPFLSPARVLELPSAPDFIEAGDFNADGFTDLAIASRNSATLYVLPGDGHGNLLQPEAIHLPGEITAMTSGDVNRRDGLADLVVGVAASRGGELLVFEGPTGVLKCTPEVIPLPASAAAVAIGYFYNSPFADIAVAAGGRLMVVHGRDRKLSMPGAPQESVPAPHVSMLKLEGTAYAIALGRFYGERNTRAAVLLDDGRLEVAGAEGETSALHSFRLTAMAPGGAGREAALVRASLSGQRLDDLVLVDQASGSLRILPPVPGTSVEAGEGVTSDQPGAIDLPVDDAPIAVLPMRLNPGSRTDLVVLRKGHLGPSIVPEAFTNIFVVNSTADDPSGPTQGITTLRDAINAANTAAAGSSNEIEFDIPQSNPVITLQASLPALSANNTVTIDGTTEVPFGGTPMQINGASNDVITLRGSGHVIKGLVINNSDTPIQILEAANNIIEENLIGTLPDGVTPAQNQGPGILDTGGEDNTIGGVTAQAANVIGASLVDGIVLQNVCFSETITGNFVGVDQNLDNNRNLANAGNGIQIESGSSQITIGSALAGNHFDFNGANGIATSSGSNVMIVNNVIQGNLGSGISASTLITQIGGVQGSGLGNSILLNSQDGIVIGPFQSDGTAVGGAQIQGNLIGVAFSNGVPQAAGNGLSGVIVDSGPTVVGGDQASLGNQIGFNGGEGVGVYCRLSGVSILFNVIGGNAGQPIGEGAFNPPPTFCPGSTAIPVQIVSATVVPGSSPALNINYNFVTHSVALPNQSVELLFYVSQTCNCANCFAGGVGIFSTHVTTDANGNPPSPISIPMATVPSVGSFVSAISTPTSGPNIGTTSQFSPCVQIGAPAGPAFSIDVSPGSITGTPGQAIPVTINITRGGGFTGPVTIKPPAKANGIKPKPNTTVQISGSSYTLKMKITSAASPGTTQFTFTGTGSVGTQRATLSVTVQ